MEAMYKRLREKIKRENDNKKHVIPFNMSVGYAHTVAGNKSIRDLMREADNKMYREKLFTKAGTEGSSIQTIRKMLMERDYGTGTHSDRLNKLIADFAVASGMQESELADTRLFAEFHDVGKIGVPDHILHKPGPLTKDEKKQMQQHTEIGFRIAKASSDLVPISDWILKHHEWWNGKGYPLGIDEEKIPLACRLLAIVDAYDAMTSDRPYRKAMSHDEAVKELRKYAGVQFDPRLIEIFINLITGTHNISKAM